MRFTAEAHCIPDVNHVGEALQQQPSGLHHIACIVSDNASKLLRAPSVYLIDDHGCTIKKIVRLSTKLLLLQDCIYEVYLIDFPLCVRWKTGHQL
jgi:hypothetical protein